MMVNKSKNTGKNKQKLSEKFSKYENLEIYNVKSNGHCAVSGAAKVSQPVSRSTCDSTIVAGLQVRRQRSCQRAKYIRVYDIQIARKVVKGCGRT